MILPCPLCQTRYLIQASLFAMGPRQVRCARCSHSWLAELPKEIDVVAPPEPEALSPPPVAVPPPPIPPGSNLPVKVRKPLPKWAKATAIAVAAVIGVFILAWLVIDRQEIAFGSPTMEHIYDTVGLTIYHYGEGLSFDKVRSEIQYDSGAMKLVVEGVVHNNTIYVQQVPDILATAIGPDGQSIQGWRIDAPAPRVFPHDGAPFRSAVSVPKGTVVEVNLNFAELKNAAERSTNTP